MFRLILGLIGLSALLTVGFAGQEPLPASAKKPSARYTALGYSGEFLATFEVKDVQRTIDFYTKSLGFELVMHVPEIGWAEVTSPVSGAKIGFGPPAEGKPASEPFDRPTISLGVEDIDATIKLLKESKVSFEGDIVTVPGAVRLATFLDPDGNRLMLHQSLMK